jgi:FADH2-dependent halogenase
VFDKDEFTQATGTPQEIFQRWVDSTPSVKKRMNDARLLGAIQTTSDFSYHNRRLVGHRLLRVGDAAGFMDPIFSAGVFLASWSGKLAAETVIKSLERGKPSASLFAKYEKRVRRGLKFYWRVVEHYYTTPFMEIFLRPSNHYDLPSAVNAVLAGELEGGWSLRWRLAYFFLLVKVQRHFKIVPPIFFGATRPRKLNPMPRPQKS